MKRVAAMVALAGCGSGAAAHDAAGTAPDAQPAPAAEIHYLGRFTDEHRFAWSGSAIRTRFAGTTLSVTLDDSGQNQFDVLVDGVAGPVLRPTAGTGTYLLADGVADAEHDLVIARRTEAFFGVTTFGGFAGAPLVATPGPSRSIEFVGDSITCGYGVLGDAATCPFSADTEDESRAWGALAAADLGAAHSAIAYSGIGVYRDYGGSTVEQMPARYTRTLAEDATSVWSFARAPDVVVIDLGTNDFAGGDPGQPFVDAYVDFAAAIRGHYADAWILIAHSPMLSDTYPEGAMHRTLARQHLEAVIAARQAAGDARIAYVDVAEQLAGDGYGCDYHPNQVTARKMADVLVARIRELAGW